MHKYFAYHVNYHFLAEGTLTFIIFLPITYAYYDLKHYFVFLGILIVIAFVYLLIERYFFQKNILFVIAIFLGMFLFYHGNFPIVLSLIFPLIFLWRYMLIRRYESQRTSRQALIYRKKINRVNLYIKIGVISVGVVLLYSKEFYVFIPLFSLLIFLYGGYILSHLSMIDRGKHKLINAKIFAIVPLILVIGGFVFLYLLEPLRPFIYQVWVMISQTFVYMIGLVVGFIEHLIPNRLKDPSRDIDPSVILRNPSEFNSSFQAYEPGLGESFFSILLIAFVIFLLIYYLLRTFHQGGEIPFIREEADVKFVPRDKKSESETPRRELFNKRRIPRHPVRQLIYNFERDAKKYNLERLPFESLEEWFNRLKIEINVEIYKKVRYGLMEVSKEEIDCLEKKLKRVNLKEITLQEQM